jgi:hypothetical protein
VRDIGSGGAWLLAGSGVVIVIEGVVAGVWTTRLARRARVLAQRIETERGLLQADVERLQLALEETRRLWQPYRRILRFLRHPLVAALVGSYRRRWAAR